MKSYCLVFPFSDQSTEIHFHKKMQKVHKKKCAAHEGWMYRMCPSEL